MGKDGTVREALVAQERISGRRNDELDFAIPEQCSELWALFLALHASRPSGIDGIEPLQPTEVESMTRLLGIKLTPWEVETIFALDRAVIRRALSKREQSK